MLRTLTILTHIIFYYSIFYGVLKIIAALSGTYPVANLILMLPFVLFAWAGRYVEKHKKYMWIYVVVGILVISAVRYYESEWMLRLQQQFTV